MSNSAVIWQKFNNTNQGQIPGDWETFQLNDLLDGLVDFRGRTPLKIGMKWGGGDIPALSANNVEMGRINLEKETYYGSEALYRKWMNKGDTEKGDILLTMEAPLGNVAQIPDSRKYILSQRTVLLKTKKNLILNDFLKHQLMSEGFQTSLKSYSTGTTATGIQQAKLLTLPVVIPSFLEQQKITQILDTIDNLITLTDRHIAKLKQAKAGLLHDLLTRGIDENGELRDPIKHPEQFKETAIRQIPRNWDVSRLDNLMERITSGSRWWARYYSDYGALFIRIGNLTREHLNLRLNETMYVCPPFGSEGERTRVQAGDILISITADLGIIGVIPEGFGEAYINQHIALVRLKQEDINPQWVGLYLSQEMGQRQFRQKNDSGAKAGLNLPTIKSIFIALPKYEEQNKIVSTINSYDNKIRCKQVRLEKLKLFKKGLMADLLTGRVRVNLDRIEED